MRIHDIPGSGATIAVIDSGMPEQKALGQTPAGFLRLLAACGAEDNKGQSPTITGFASTKTKAGSKTGTADPGLVVARAFSVDDMTSRVDVIRAVEWVIANRDQYRIRAMDLAFHLTQPSTRRDDLLNQAVMAAWKAEIVVVSSTGTAGF